MHEQNSNEKQPSTAEEQIDAAAASMLTEVRKQANQQGVAMTTLLSERFKEAIRSLGIPL